MGGWDVLDRCTPPLAIRYGVTSATVAGEQLRQLHRLKLIPTLATVTMGGNDLLAAYGNSTAGRQAIQRMTDSGQRLLASLRALMGPMAPIVVATVYDPSNGTGDAVRWACRSGRPSSTC